MNLPADVRRRRDGRRLPRRRWAARVPHGVAALAKALLEAQKHRATLCGATDAPTTQVNVNVGVVDPVQIAVQRFGLDPDQLGALGDGLAGQLTDRARVVLEADFEEAG